MHTSLDVKKFFIKHLQRFCRRHYKRFALNTVKFTTHFYCVYRVRLGVFLVLQAVVMCEVKRNEFWCFSGESLVKSLGCLYFFLKGGFVCLKVDIFIWDH